MTKILCSISGIEYTCQHFNLYLTSRESHHPIFNLSAPRLIELTPKWINQELSHTENYLLYLALFKSTGLMEFRVPAMPTPEIFPIIAQNMHRLTTMVEKILDASDARKQEILHLPTLIISPDTKDLIDSPNWISIWEGCYKDYQDSYKSSNILQKLAHKESILEKHIKDRNKDISLYAHQLASWAAMAGKFPEFPVDVDDISAFKSTPVVSMSQYWQYIIKASAKTESIWDIPNVDIEDLIEHCDLNIEHGTIYKHTLMALLKSGMEKKKNHLNLGDINIGANGNFTFRILDGNSSIEDANKLAAIDSAPMNEPKASEYPNKIAFLRAKMNYKMKMDYMNNENKEEKGND